MQVNGYTRESILEILQNADSSYDTETIPQKRGIIGTLYQNASEEDKLAVVTAASRIGFDTIDQSTLIQHALRRNEFLSQVRIAANAVDLTLTSIIDRETFGKGRETTDSIAANIESPMIGLSNEMFASQAAISEILGIKQMLEKIDGRKIVLSWGFGSRFDYPNIAHSLLLFLPLLGVDIHVSAPSDFGLLNRVKRKAEKIASESGSTL
ncbi:MAG: hypothetical protein ACXAEF_08890, partial [Candidatus Thorarchaeota archaeon]